MVIEYSRLIVQFQRLITEMLVEKRLGQRRPDLADEVYRTWHEIEQRGSPKLPSTEICFCGQIGTLCGLQDWSSSRGLHQKRSEPIRWMHQKAA